MKKRWKFAYIHCLLSLAIASTVGGITFWLWYPTPFRQELDIVRIFLLLVAVDVIVGPLLTAIVCSEFKPSRLIKLDLAIIGVVQCAALAYGVYSIAFARPVYIAFEADRFRVVTAADLDALRLRNAPEHLQHLPWTGPKAIAVATYDSGDPRFLQSLESALQGLHPAYQPNRWIDYSAKAEEIANVARTEKEIVRHNPHLESLIRAFENTNAHTRDELGFVPLVYDTPWRWAAVVSKNNGKVLGYAEVSAWVD